jgi:hypothetical protein
VIPERRTSGYCKPYAHTIVLDLSLSPNDPCLVSWYNLAHNKQILSETKNNSRANLSPFTIILYVFFYLLASDVPQRNPSRDSIAAIFKS